VSNRVLVVGLNPFDSGKTGVSIQLIQRMKDSRAVEFFKPISGHNYWYRHEHTQFCLENKQLVSYDATRVRRVYQSRLHDFVANPVHALYVPARLQTPGKAPLSTLALAGWDSVLAMERMSHPQGNRVESTMMIARDLIQKEQLLLTPEQADRLSSGIKLRPVTRLEEVQNNENDCFERYVSESFNGIERSSDSVVIESFNDSAWPWEGLDRVETVLAVGPGHVFTYEPEKFRLAVFLSKHESGPVREVTFARIADMLKPLKKVALVPGEGLTDEAFRDLHVV